MAWIFCTSGAAVAKAGHNVSTNIKASGTALWNYSDEVEGQICAECRYDFVANYTGLDTEIKNALANAASSGVSIRMVAYDPAEYSTSKEAGLIVDIQDSLYKESLKTLKEKENQEFS